MADLDESDEGAGLDTSVCVHTVVKLNEAVDLDL